MAKRRRISLGWRGNVFLGFLIVLGITFLPTSLLLMVGMLPTFMASILDRTSGKIKTLTVGSMNLAGCIPFIIKLWMGGHTMAQAAQMITQPEVIVVMYMAAAIGYLIDWSVTGIVIGIMAQKGKARLRQIEREQEVLAERWGEEVRGKIKLDAFGFALETPISGEKEEKE